MGAESVVQLFDFDFVYKVMDGVFKILTSVINNNSNINYGVSSSLYVRWQAFIWRCSQFQKTDMYTLGIKVGA